MRIPVFVLLAVLVAGCVQTPWYSKSQEDVLVTMDEFSFKSSVTEFRKGVEYTFVIKNAGKIPHEFAIAPMGVTDHAKMLLHLNVELFPPGAEVRKKFTFTQDGKFEFACHIMGHYENMMILIITVN
ncbi:MAG: cupredoxin domain-containing protein [Candidatus Aenigmarchaeota archaeon]|nr:cupredoxin domain-containing protein [Candidatus Aenigmarchaeota archaeon]